MQREITKPCYVFEKSGEVMQAGWSKRSVFVYNSRQSSTAGHHGERDCYFINNGEVSLYISVEKSGFEFAIKIAVADLRRGGVISDCVVKKLNFKRIDLPEEGNKGELLYTDKRIQLQLTNSIDGRILKCDFIDFGGIKNLYFNIFLTKIKGESLNELAPFERNRKYFYLKRFVPKYIAQGVIRVGGLEYALNPNNSRAYFDWTRYSKPRKHNYQRLGADCMIDGKRFSLCLASRVGDNRFGNENSFFSDGHLYKLPQVNVKGTTKRIGRPVYFSDDDGILDITFKPFTVKGSAMSADMDKTSVIFGRLYGTIKTGEQKNPIVLDNSQAHLIFSEF